MSAIYAVQPVTAPSVSFILKHLWERGRKELAALRVSSATALVMALKSAATPGAVSGVVTVDGVPVMVAGIVPEDGEAVTWFLATDDFDKHAKMLTKIVRQYTKEFPSDVHIYSTLAHRDAGRWFRALGYVQDDWQGETPSGHPLYRFRRK